MKPTNSFINEVIKFSQDIAFEAGEIILKYQKMKNEILIKDKGVNGLASEADEKSEEFLLKEITKKYPKHYILSEEDFENSKSKSFKLAQESEYAWVIDPLDGTNNFINGIPIYAISICLMYQGSPLIGTVYNPLSGECFFAAKSKGASLIDFRINPLKRYSLEIPENKKKMSECIFSPAPVYDQGSRFEQQLSTFKKNITGARAVRRLGSAALELCYVASGNFDAYWEQDLKPWDVAAACLICEEAGIKVTDYNGRLFTPFKDSIIAAQTNLHKRIISKIS